jgi:hypothetical protein
MMRVACEKMRVACENMRVACEMMHVACTVMDRKAAERVLQSEWVIMLAHAVLTSCNHSSATMERTGCIVACVQVPQPAAQVLL